MLMTGWELFQGKDSIIRDTKITHFILKWEEGCVALRIANIYLALWSSTSERRIAPQRRRGRSPRIHGAGLPTPHSRTRV
jgi:hypothetical protein